MMWLFHHYLSPPPSLTCSQTPSVTSTIEEEKAGGVFSEFSPSLRHCPLYWGSLFLSKKHLSADCAQHRAVNTSSAAPGEALRPEFVVDAVEPGTHRDSVSLNPMRWAFLSWPHRRINPDFAADARWLWLLLFRHSSVFCFVGKRRKTQKSLFVCFFLCERATEMCAPAPNAQVGLSGVKCVG